ncbi:lipoprotein [Spiroplasma citri]|uniref:Lipoprotein n=1 Tax=Spiroplasma citri TaxID=2133 RepID=A0AAX3T116_SPICI|nr:lipoprotein [Spiroplasma citri]WFG97054.1 lipoprotein [Spiroplasma citri]
MKKWLSFLGAITLLGTSTTSLVACNNIPQYNEDELQQLKKENQIDTNYQEIKDNLEWIAPQEKPFNEVDNKYYFVVWRSDKNDDWKIIKFNNNEKIKRWHPKTLDVQNNIKLCLTNYAEIPIDIDLSIDASTINRWKNDNGTYIKSVYRWNGEEQKLPYLVVDSCGDVKVNSE